MNQLFLLREVVLDPVQKIYPHREGIGNHRLI